VLLPASLLDQLLSAPGFDRELFLQAHQAARPTPSIRLNPSKKPDLAYAMQPVGWCANGYYLDARPSFTFDPLFHAGCYYVQEASSMLLEQAFMQLMPQDRPLRVLDLCASPGGKSTHLYSLLPSGSFLVANEVIRSRAWVLRDNLVRWGTSHAIVTNNDPEQFREIQDYFDWITVDAPCSGSGLFRKDPEAIGQWSSSSVQHCAARQQRILSAAWQALRPGGILFYATCSYSIEENEAIAAWMIKEFEATFRELRLDKAWGITPTDPGYRCWPYQTKGEGFFCCCLQKPLGTASDVSTRTVKELRPLDKQEWARVMPWVHEEEAFYFSLQQNIYGWPREWSNEWQTLVSILNVIYSGVRVGQLMRDKLVPDHALSQQPILNDAIPSVSLILSDAIAYLQRRPISVLSAQKGWSVVSYEGFSLGWVNVLANRINNYYPKELRIIKERQFE
jgi:16S rRNA C967 or C1407 C5-methylase (RsmB/RsmF family)/NOL1/NOP2/fmu family ribosome biogenesis protein